MQKRFVSTSTHILNPVNSSTHSIQPSAPPIRSPGTLDPSDQRIFSEKLVETKAKKQEAYEEACKFSLTHLCDYD